MTFLGIPSAHLATTSASATTNKQVRNGVGSLCESVASQSVVHSSYMSYFIYFSQPIGICGFKGSTIICYSQTVIARGTLLVLKQVSEESQLLLTRRSAYHHQAVGVEHNSPSWHTHTEYVDVR